MRHVVRWRRRPALHRPCPGGIDRFKDGPLVWPKDSVLAEDALATTSAACETAVLHYDGSREKRDAYLWTREQTDADLVEARGAVRGRTWGAGPGRSGARDLLTATIHGRGRAGDPRRAAETGDSEYAKQKDNQVRPR